MAGGNWSAQNKVRPGVYINFKSEGAPPVNQGVRGTVAIAKALSWGEPGKAVEIAAGADVTPYVGVPLTDPGALFLREMFKERGSCWSGWRPPERSRLRGPSVRGKPPSR